MAKKNARNTRGRIVEAAWRLFYDQGYEDTTVEEIIESSQTSKGSFYHYFDGKDALLSTLSDLFDQKYQDLQAVMPPEMPTMEKLLFLNRELFRMIEDSVSIDLMARLLSRIIAEGQAAGELTQSRSVNDMVKVYALCERALMYDWCLCGGDYSLAEYAARQLPVFLHDFLPGTSSENRSEETD